MKTTCGLAIALGVMAASPAFAQAPAPLDSRWTPWLGCWRLVQDVAQASPPASMAPATQPVTSGTNAGEIIVCVLPTNTDVGVKMTTFAGGRSVLEQRILGDGISHPIAEPDCRGAQASEWSRDGARLFTRAELECGGQPRRRISGVTLLAPMAVWLDIQTVDVDGDQHVRIRRYVRTFDLPVEAVELPADVSARAIMAARELSTIRIGIDDVIEASSKIDSQAVEAVLLETGSRVDLNSRALIKLGDAGVQANVIDLMVALAFPERFRVERAQRGGGTPVITGGGGLPGVYGSAPYGGYYPYGVYDPNAYYYYYYSPFAYGYWDNYPYAIGSSSPAIVVPNGTSGEASGAHGRVIQGRGYTQVTPNGTADPARATSGTGARTSSSSNESSASSNDSSSSSSGGNGGVSNQGYSGGSSGDSERTAQPR